MSTFLMQFLRHFQMPLLNTVQQLHSLLLSVYWTKRYRCLDEKIFGCRVNLEPCTPSAAGYSLIIKKKFSSTFHITKDFILTRQALSDVLHVINPVGSSHRRKVHPSLRHPHGIDSLLVRFRVPRRGHSSNFAMSIHHPKWHLVRLRSLIRKLEWDWSLHSDGSSEHSSAGSPGTHLAPKVLEEAQAAIQLLQAPQCDGARHIPACMTSEACGG